MSDESNKVKLNFSLMRLPGVAILLLTMWLLCPTCDGAGCGPSRGDAVLERVLK